jgi:hypothetical protein
MFPVLMKLNCKKILSWAVIILLLGYVIGSEIYYANRISPRGISTVKDFFARFGQPRQIRMVERDGQSYYEFTGGLPGRFLLATPSTPPAYVFDAKGQFSGWCSDPGDMPAYREKWPLQSTNEIDVRLVRQKFGF